jgi:hypothetical protein
MRNDYFIAIYTHAVKAYCDEAFFHSVHLLCRGLPVYIADNSPDETYYRRLKDMFATRGYDSFYLFRVDVASLPAETQFLRNVCDSVNTLRDMFLREGGFPYFLILESDVVAPVDLLDRFDGAIDRLTSQQPPWGIVGGLYYQGFHNYHFSQRQTTLERTQHVLSGCTVYRRELIRKYPFRFDPTWLGPFPDGWICHDSRGEYSLWNEHQICCAHLHNPVNGLRVV